MGKTLLVPATTHAKPRDTKCDAVDEPPAAPAERAAAAAKAAAAAAKTTTITQAPQLAPQV